MGFLCCLAVCVYTPFSKKLEHSKARKTMGKNDTESVMLTQSGIETTDFV